MENNITILADRLKKIREQYNVSLQALQEITKYNCDIKYISHSVMSKWELNKSIPQVDYLLAYADIFGVSVLWLYGRDNEPYNSKNLLAIEENVLCHIPEQIKFILPMDYLTESERVKKYSLEWRAKLLFTIRCEWVKYKRLISFHDI